MLKHSLLSIEIIPKINKLHHPRNNNKQETRDVLGQEKDNLSVS